MKKIPLISIPQEAQALKSFHAYITGNKIFYSYSLLKSQPVKLQLISITGATILTRKNSNPDSGSIQGEINCSGLKRGMYSLRLFSSQGMEVQKLVKY